MKRLLALAAALAIGLGVLACSTTPGGDSGWVTLIDGTTGLENFNRVGDANWRAEGGAIVADLAKGNSYLVSKNSYANFQIRAEFWADHTTNSGVFIRLSDPNKVGADNSYEVNIYDQAPRPEFSTGSIVNFAKVATMPKAGGKWNTYLITARGTNVVAVLNGVETVSLNDSKFASGPIALQYGMLPKNVPGGAIKWRKVQIRPL